MPRALGESAQRGAEAGPGPSSSSAAGRADAEQAAVSIAGRGWGRAGSSGGGGVAAKVTRARHRQVWPAEAAAKPGGGEVDRRALGGVVQRREADNEVNIVNCWK